MTNKLNADNQESVGTERTEHALFVRVYDELRRLAARSLRQWRPGMTLSATALVHEAFLKLGKGLTDGSLEGERHFINVAVSAMRKIIISSERKRRAVKRGGARHRQSLSAMLMSGESPAVPAPSTDLLDLDACLRQLEARSPQQAKLVELRYFLGMTMPEAAAQMGIPLRTAEDWWSKARAWLHVCMHPPERGSNRQSKKP